jgi:hypothetical protein
MGSTVVEPLMTRFSAPAAPALSPAQRMTVARAVCRDRRILFLLITASFLDDFRHYVIQMLQNDDDQIKLA